MKSEASNYYGQDRAEVAPFLPAEYERVLEVGCGEGGFRSNLRDSCECWGIEPDLRAAEVAESRLTRVLVGTFDNVVDELPDGYFDLVICNDVIEHIADTDAFFRKLRPKLSPGARLVGSIPNVREFYTLTNLLLKKDWEYTEAGILDRTHLRFFTEKSLRRLFAEQGMIVEEFARINRIPLEAKTPKQVIGRLMAEILGRDTLYAQFAFRVRVG